MSNFLGAVHLRGAHPAMLPLQKIANCQKNGQKDIKTYF